MVIRCLSTLLIFCVFIYNNALGIDPERGYKFKPDKYGLKYEEKKLLTSDNFKINIWEYVVIDSLKKDITIILLGTDAGNMSYLITQAYYFQSKGYQVISFDYRGFGDSSEFEIDKDFLYYDEYVTDLNTVIDYAKKKYPKNKFGVYALSMGSTITFFSSTTQKLDFIVADGVVTNPAAIVERIKLQKGKDIKLPTSSDRFQNIISQITSPMLLIVGSQDKITTIRDCESILSQQENRNLFVHSGSHLESLKKLKNAYIEYIDIFIRNSI